MTARLIKHDSPIAREAMLRLVTEAGPITVDGPSVPTAEDREIARLEAEVEALAAERDAALSDWASELEAARTSAKSEAAREHVAEDRKRSEALERSLADARQSFEGMLATRVEPLAAQLAARAFAQLVALREGEEDWLGRIIARRLESIAAASVVAVHLAPDEGEALIPLLHEHGLERAMVKLDAAQKPGTAKLVLQLGEIAFHPRDGAEEIVRLLEGAGGELG